jgi:hypothetical protein
MDPSLRPERNTGPCKDTIKSSQLEDGLAPACGGGAGGGTEDVEQWSHSARIAA